MLHLPLREFIETVLLRSHFVRDFPLLVRSSLAALYPLALLSLLVMLSILIRRWLDRCGARFLFAFPSFSRNEERRNQR